MAAGKEGRSDKAKRSFFSFLYLAIVFFISWLLFFGFSLGIGKVAEFGEGAEQSSYVKLALDFLTICLGLTILAALGEHLKNLVMALVDYVNKGHARGWRGFVDDRLEGWSVVASIAGLCGAALTAQSSGAVVQGTTSAVERITNVREIHRTDRVYYETLGFSQHPLTEEDESPFLWRVRFSNGRLRANVGCEAAATADDPERIFVAGASRPIEEFSGQAESDLERLIEGLKSKIASCEPDADPSLLKLEITGFSSDTGFASCPERSDAINRQLELARARVVQRWLERDPQLAGIEMDPGYSSERKSPPSADSRNSPYDDLARSTVVEVKVVCPARRLSSKVTT